jgi:FdrA protein
MGLEALLCDEDIRVVVLIGKPPAPSVEGRILRILEDGKKPAAVGFIGGKASGDKPPLYLCRELEETAAVAAALANGKDPSSAREGLFKSYERLKEKAAPMKRKGFIRGLYSGGTLCYEAQLIATGLIGSVYSNAPLASEMKLADSLKSRGHTMVDYGEDEFTQGRLHPMMDSTFRAERLLSESQDPDVGVILFDCVLGYGCHPNPAGQMAEAVEKARKKAGGRIVYVAYVCGVDADPQGATEQRKILEEAGVTVCDSNAEAARLACYIVG